MSEQRQNANLTLLPSASRTAAQNNTAGTGDTTNAGCKGVKVVIDITAVPGSAPSITFTIQGKDEVSAKYYTILASSALTGTGTTVLTVYPGLTAANNSVASDVLPRTWRVNVAVGNGNAATYSVGAALIV